jgi:hypothetical protein
MMSFTCGVIHEQRIAKAFSCAIKKVPQPDQSGCGFFVVLELIRVRVAIPNSHDIRQARSAIS